MNNKGVGSIFCLIAAILFGARYITAGLLMSNSPTQSADLFSYALGYIGSPLVIASIVALVIGVCFLVLGFIKDAK